MDTQPINETQLQLREHEPLAAHCRFHVGGPADYFTIATSPEQLIVALKYAQQHGLRHFVYGGGSNLFFDDAGFRGLVIKLENGGLQIDGERLRVSAGAGYDLGRMVRAAAERNLGGLEFLANIPGSVGGAVVGNAGCYGHAVAEVLHSAVLYEVASGTTRDVERDFFEYGYRHSRLKYTADYVVLSATFRATPGDGAQILREIDSELSTRLRKHPHSSWCAGSFFKNPGAHLPAWQAIGDAGMGKARVGDAMLSPLHMNFLVNAGQATSAQIIELVRQIQRAVREKLGLSLTPEVRYVSPEGIVELLGE